jgi:hypothetical protein
VKKADDEWVTATEVVAAFKAAPGRGRFPDESMVVELVEYINDNAWADRVITRTPRGFRRKSPLMDPFWQALTAIERTGTQVLDSQRFIRGVHMEAASRLSVDMDASKIDARITKIEEIISLSKELRTSMFPGHYGKRHERWHDVAMAIAPLIANSYRSAGRLTIDFQSATSAGVHMVQWTLVRFGHHTDNEAVAQAFKRAKFRTIPRP